MTLDETFHAINASLDTEPVRDYFAGHPAAKIAWDIEKEVVEGKLQAYFRPTTPPQDATAGHKTVTALRRLAQHAVELERLAHDSWVGRA